MKQEQGNREGWKAAGRGKGLDKEERSKEREGRKERIKWEGQPQREETQMDFFGGENWGNTIIMPFIPNNCKNKMFDHG